MLDYKKRLACIWFATPLPPLASGAKGGGSEISKINSFKYFDFVFERWFALNWCELFLFLSFKNEFFLCSVSIVKFSASSAEERYYTPWFLGVPKLIINIFSFYWPKEIFCKLEIRKKLSVIFIKFSWRACFEFKMSFSRSYKESK